MGQRLMLQHGEKTPSPVLPLLGAFCLFFSSIEYVIPKPLPFLRLGLANIPLMLALDIFLLKHYVLLVLLKIAGQAIISGTLFSPIFLFSLAGSSASALCMYVFRKSAGPRFFGFTSVSVAGAFSSNAVQIVLARYFIFGDGIRLIIPWVLCAGLVSGTALGLFCEVFTAQSRWFRHGLQSDFLLTPCPTANLSGKASSVGVNGERTAAFALILAAFFATDNLLFRSVQFVMLLILLKLSGKRNRLHITVLIMASIVLFNVLRPYGKVLFAVGPFVLSSGALTTGLHKALSLEGLVILSRLCITPGLRLPGAFGALLAQTLAIFNRISLRKKSMSRKSFMADIDTMLMELSASLGTGDIDIIEEDAVMERRKQEHSITARLALWISVSLFLGLSAAACMFSNLRLR
ncbi:Gx transporter family protein [Breznakiellaceae bacterium SP9]